jgi:DNA-binding transcriptional MerR regulator
MFCYYEEIGLIKSSRKDDYAYRVYDEEAIKRLQQIIILRKLQIPMKQIKDILNNPTAVAVIEIFNQNISELDEQITALSVVKSILTRLVDELQKKADTHLNLNLLNDKTMIAAINSLSLSENKIKEKVSMEELNKASETLRKRNEDKIMIEFNVVEFPENIKVAGVPCHYGGLAEGEYIDEYETKYESIMRNLEYVYEPYTYVDVWSSVLGIKREHAWTSGDRIYGCLVKSLDNLPKGIVGAEIKIKKFLVLTARSDSWDDIIHLDNKFKELMPIEYADSLYPPIKEVNHHFQIEGIDENETFYISYIESNTPNCGAVKEKKFYAPMK